jgi:Lon protease-like protein
MDKKVFLFPLTNSIMFKKVVLPFHIFEPRYRQMVHDAIEHQIPIAVVPYDPISSYEGVICVAGIPHILTTYSDGRMDIFITGSVKCRLTEFSQEDPYKIYHYEALDESLHLQNGEEFDLENLRGLLERWADHYLSDYGQRQNFARTLKDDEMMINYCAVFLTDELSIKKKVMEAETITKKIQFLIEAVGPKEISLGPFLPTLKF